MLHLQSRSFSEHMALNTFYSELPELADAVIEAYQGKYGHAWPITPRAMNRSLVPPLSLSARCRITSQPRGLALVQILSCKISAMRFNSSLIPPFTS